MSAPQALLDKLLAFGATLLEYKGSHGYSLFVCSCGEQFSRSWANLSKKGCRAVCTSCANSNRVTSSRWRVEATFGAIRERCSEWGAIPDLTTYKSARTPFKITCRCGTIFEKVWRDLSRSERRVLCSSCSNELQRGPNHPNWKPEKLDADRTERHYDLRYTPWVNAVLKAHDYTCAISGQRGINLAPHHLFNWADYPDLRFEVSNGVAISQDLHKEFHKLYGRGNNTLEQFQEFFYIKTGRPFEQIHDRHTP